jgi:hypothetical protein
MGGGNEERAYSEMKSLIKGYGREKRLGPTRLDISPLLPYMIQYIDWFEVCTEVVVMITVFWDVKVFNLEDICRPLGGTYCLHIQGRS